jgi:quinolinate synthase
VGTEAGMIHRLSLDAPGKHFFLATEATICPTMKLTTLRKAIDALRNEGPVVTVPADVRERALRAVQRMVEIGGP